VTAYLDHAATTPMLPAALAAMTEQLAVVGNASSLHRTGRAARRAVEESRERIARCLGARPSEIVFTSGGTESDNLAVKGTYWSRRDRDPARVRLLVGATEHHAVLDCVDFLVAHEGAKVTWLDCTPEGVVEPATVRAAIESDPDSVALVSVMWANNEVGAVQDVRAIADVAHEFGVPFHTDAVQAFGQVPLGFTESGVDAMTVTAHKIGGPVGIGALLLRRGLTVTPLTHGGGQERDVRSGTLDAAGAAAFAAAAQAAARGLPAEAARLASLRDELVRQVLAAVPTAVLNGAPPGPGRLPGNAHLSFPGCEGDSLLMLLDARGIECSTGSACTSGVARPSHVLLAMGAGEQSARGSLRFSLGHTSTAADVEAVVAAIAPVVERASRAGELAGLGGA
jgi:cysteine desulfurase